MARINAELEAYKSISKLHRLTLSNDDGEETHIMVSDAQRRQLEKVVQ